MCDAAGRPLRLLITAGPVSDYKGAALLLPGLPPTQVFLGDRGYDADWIRNLLEEKGTEVCIPSRRCRTTPIFYDKKLYRCRHKIENMFSRLKDWRRIATRYDRCAHTFLSAIQLAAIVIFYL